MINQLQVIVEKSGLEITKAKIILEKFQNYFEIASEWEKKAKTIVITSENQKAEMEMARIGRLFLREKRIAIENARKELKEQALREGKAIDGIANVLKALIVPIEEYLEEQEYFVEIQRAKREETLRLEAEKRIEEEQIAKEKAYAEELEKKRIENEYLKKEAEEREKSIALERKKQEETLAKEQAKAAAEKAAIEAEIRAEKEKARKEKEIQEQKLAEVKVKAETERKEAEERERVLKEKERIKLEAERKEKERLEKILKNQIECPFCHKKFQRKDL